MAKSGEMFSRDACNIGNVLKLRFYPITVEKGKGSKLIDVDGKEYIDFNAGWAVANTGYCHPRIIKAVHKQMQRLSFSSLTSVLSTESIELAEKLKELTPGSFDKKVWFGHSGSDANEFIAKIAPLASGRPRILTFVGSYHGQTMGSYVMSGHPAQSKFIGGGNVVKLPYPYCYRCVFDKKPSDCGLFCLNYIKDYIFKSVCRPEQVAALVIEAIQSDGGDIVPPDGFLKGLQEICNERGIYFIIDEVKVGFGRTGKFFGFENWDVVPDAVIMGKPMASGQPLSAVVGRKELMDAGVGQHLFTTAGNPVACAAGLETLSVIKEEKLEENAAKIGNYLLEQFHKLEEKHEIIGDVRGKGLITGIELVKDRVTKEPADELAALVVYRSYELGLLYYYAGIHSNVLEFTPPLVITMKQAKKAVKIIDQSIEEVLAGKITGEKLKDFAGWGC
ncbi:MAG TPA: aspartate aminotransferase family protein [Anaerovoracaceae bacterium]|nr:aspartate aminotransferase family protein [Anaerovoracaceae bacterium]